MKATPRPPASTREAANRDPGFYAFQRSLEAYRRRRSGTATTVIVLDKDDPFLQYMKDDR